MTAKYHRPLAYYSRSFFFKEIYCTRVYTACTGMRYKIVPETNCNTCHHWKTSGAE